MSELICVDANYNQVECSDPKAAYSVTPADAKKRGGKLIEAGEVEEKAVESAPENKAVTMPRGKK